MFRGRKRAQAEGGRSSQSDVASTPTAQLSSSASSGDGESNPYVKHGLGSSPRGEQGNVAADKALRRIQKDGFGRFVLCRCSDKTKMLMFLYGRGFMQLKSKSKRKAKVKEMMEGEAAERLLRVLGADGDRDLTRAGEDLFLRNSLTLLRYFKQEGAFGFLPEMNDAKYFFRTQKCGNCFLRVPCVLLAYLTQKQGIEEKISGPADVSKFVRRSFCDEALN